MCSGQEVMKEWQMCIPIQSYSYDKFVSNFWDTVPKSTAIHEKGGFCGWDEKMSGLRHK